MRAKTQSSQRFVLLHHTVFVLFVAAINVGHFTSSLFTKLVKSVETNGVCNALY